MVVPTTSRDDRAIKLLTRFFKGSNVYTKSETVDKIIAARRPRPYTNSFRIGLHTSPSIDRQADQAVV
jgi:hypothetical protein